MKAISIDGVAYTITDVQTFAVVGRCNEDTVSLKTTMPESTEDLYANYTMVDSIPRLKLNSSSVSVDVRRRFANENSNCSLYNFRVSHV